MLLLLKQWQVFFIFPFQVQLRLQIRIIDYDGVTPDDLVDIINVNINIPSTLESAAFTAPQSYRGIAGVSTMRISYQVTETTPSATTPTTEAVIPTTEATIPNTEAANPTTEAADITHSVRQLLHPNKAS